MNTGLVPPANKSPFKRGGTMHPFQKVIRKEREESLVFMGKKEIMCRG